MFSRCQVPLTLYSQNYDYGRFGDARGEGLNTIDVLTLFSRDFIKSAPGARPTNNFSIKFEIQCHFVMLLFIPDSTDQNKFVILSCLKHCRDVC